MQRYAEESVVEHMKELQSEFFREKKGRKTAPYTSRLTQEQVDEIMNRAVRQSDRYRVMNNAEVSETEINKAFNTPQEMSVFTWDGVIDTVMTPMDSIR